MNLFALKYNKRNFFVSIIVLGIIFFSEDTFTFGTSASSVSFLKYIVYIILFLVLCLKIGPDRYIKNNTLFLLIILSSIFLTFLSNLDFTGGYVYQFFIVTFAFLIATYINLDSFVVIYNKILFILCSISLFLFIVATNFSWLLGYFPIQENIAAVQFTNIYIACVMQGVGEVRNTGIFREPGVYTTYILLGIIFELFYMVKPRVLYVALFVVTLLTTYSTAGILVFMLVLAAYIISTRENSRKLKIATILVLFPLMIYVNFNETIFSNIFLKFNPDASSYGSTMARLASFVVNFDMLLKNPLFGSGLTNYTVLFESYAYEIYGLHLSASGQSTNSFMSLLATYGIVYGGVVIFSFYCFAGSIVKKGGGRLLLFVAFLMMFSNQDMRYSLFFNLLIFFGLKYMSNKRQLHASTVYIFCRHI